MVWDAVLLAGGAARRLGGIDKPALVIGGTTLLDRGLASVARARARVVVGPQRAVASGSVRWTREDPVGGGPLAALAAGLDALPEPAPDVVVVLATDLPYVDAGVVADLLDAVGHDDLDAACVVDEDGRRQPLLAAYRLPALASAVSAAGPPHGRPLGPVVAQLRTTLVPAGRVAFDVDTPDELAAARSALDAQD